MAKFKSYQIGLDQELTLQVGQLIPKTHLCFFVERFVWDLDTTDIETTYSNLGQGGYHPKLLLSVLFLGYIQGIRSGRKLAESCQMNLVFVYLSKGYCPKKTVLNEFRNKHVDKFEKYFKKVLTMFEVNQVDASTSIFDGSKIRANASKRRTRKKSSYEKWLGHLHTDIAEIKADLAKEQASTEKQVALEKKLAKKKDYRLK